MAAKPLTGEHHAVLRFIAHQNFLGRSPRVDAGSVRDRLKRDGLIVSTPPNSRGMRQRNGHAAGWNLTAAGRTVADALPPADDTRPAPGGGTRG